MSLAKSINVHDASNTHFEISRRSDAEHSYDVGNGFYGGLHCVLIARAVDPDVSDDAVSEERAELLESGFGPFCGCELGECHSGVDCGADEVWTQKVVEER